LSDKNDIQVLNGTSSLGQVFTLQPATKYQNMYGYGAALTQSAAYLFTQYKQRDSAAYWSLLNQLFNQSVDNDDSIAINMLRYPMGASDFILSDTNYFTYDDTAGDDSLSQLSLANAERYQIPVLKDILSINPDLKILLCPWSAPTWLKTSANEAYPQNFESGSFDDSGNNLQIYASYFVKTLQLYQSQHGIEFFAVSLQNEPLNCPSGWIVMCMSADTATKFIKVLGPMLKSNVGYAVKIMIYDHNWDNTDYAKQVLSDSTAYEWVDFTAWHCYAGSVSAMSVIHNAFPNKEQLFTECSGTGDDNFAGNLQWNADNIWTGSVANWGGAVTHWNLVLDENHNPHKNGACSNCRGIFEFDTSNNFAITRFEEWYGIGQYGKWVDARVPAKRIETTMKGQSCVSGVAFQNSNEAQQNPNRTIVVINNFCGGQQQVAVQYESAYFEASVPVGISSFLW